MLTDCSPKGLGSNDIFDSQWIAPVQFEGLDDSEEEQLKESSSHKRGSYVSQSAVALRCRVMPPPCIRNPYLNTDHQIDDNVFGGRQCKSSGSILMHCMLLYHNHLDTSPQNYHLSVCQYRVALHLPIHIFYMQGFLLLLMVMAFHAIELISMRLRFALEVWICIGYLCQVIHFHFMLVLLMSTLDFQQIGRGNFSVVFKVLKRIDGCLYAVKRSIRQLHNDRER